MFFQGISWLMLICFSILTNCALQVKEHFDLRFPAKNITSFSPTANCHTKLTELLESEVKTLVS